MAARTFSNNHLTANADASHCICNRCSKPLAGTDAAVPVPGERKEVNVFLVRKYLLFDVPEPLHNRLAIEDAIQEGLMFSGCVMHLIDEHHREPSTHDINQRGAGLESEVGLGEHVPMPEDARLGEHRLERH